MRIIIAGIAGGLVMFMWGAFSHMVLPLGDVGIKTIQNEAQIMSAMKANINEPGMYLYPGMDMSRELTAEETAAWTEKYKAGPRGILIYHPTGEEPMGPKTLLTELVSNILASIAAALVISWLICSFFGRVAAAGLIGVTSWLSIDVSLWNWYGFPTNYMLAQSIDQVAGWLLAGIVIAWIVKEKSDTMSHSSAAL